MKQKAILAFVLLGGIGVGCAPSLSQFEGRKRHQAPMTRQDVGVLVRGANTQQIMTVLQRHSSAQFRLLNEKHQMYELFGLSLHEVRGELPQAEVSQNSFIANDFKETARSERLQLYANENPPGELQRCVPGDNAPQAVIKILKGKEDIEKKLLVEKTEIKMSSEGSVNRQFPDQPLRKAWVIMAPQGAIETETILMGATLDYQTVALGAYGIGLIVQDSRNVCSLDLIEFAVTANREYLGPSQLGEEPLPSMDLSPLLHLPRVNAAASWQLSQGEGQTIAIVDSGVNFNHFALRDNILVNQKEIPDNGLDDDNNGFVDDLVGWDFNLNDNSPFDDVGHGSHVAGLAASSVFGLAKKAKILPIKALGAFGGDVGSIAAAIRYAVDQKVHIINLSLGGHSAPKRELIEAVHYAESNGVLLVTAAGNGHPMTGIGVNTDEFPVYPAGLTNKNIINVAARGSEDQLTTYSNFGAQNVDVAAPGGDQNQMLISTFLENPAGDLFAEKSGTSMAAPIVAGVAAQIWALYPHLTAIEVKNQIMNSGPPAPQLKGLVQSQRWVDALAALQPEQKLLW